MRVFWTAEAIQDLLDLWEYIVQDNQVAASKMDDLFSIAATWLCDYSKLGKSGKIQGTRELIPDKNYRLVYEISNETVWILALIHTSRQWP
jgi:addiction module RelE/StbE family toxin